MARGRHPMERIGGGVLAHQGNIGVAGVVAVCLFLAAWPLGMGAWSLLKPESAGLRRAEGFGLGVLAAGCLCAATILPFILRPGPSVFRPTTRARIEIVSPRDGEVVRLQPRAPRRPDRRREARAVHVEDAGAERGAPARVARRAAGLDARRLDEHHPGEARAGTRCQVEFVAVDHGPVHATCSRHGDVRRDAAAVVRRRVMPAGFRRRTRRVRSRVTVVPAPGAERTSTAPPSAPSRSAIPCRPVPMPRGLGLEPDAVVPNLERHACRRRSPAGS